MLILHFKKRREGGSSLTLERADGSRTWQRQDRHAEFFALHDLTHYAVETVIAATQAFYGLVAQGWDFEHFERPFARGPLPDEALLVERLVGLLDVERAQAASGAALATAADLNAMLDEKYEPPLAPRHITDAELAAIRQRRDECFAQLAALAPGDTLQFRFPV